MDASRSSRGVETQHIASCGPRPLSSARELQLRRVRFVWHPVPERLGVPETAPCHSLWPSPRCSLRGAPWRARGWAAGWALRWSRTWPGSVEGITRTYVSGTSPSSPLALAAMIHPGGDAMRSGSSSTQSCSPGVKLSSVTASARNQPREIAAEMCGRCGAASAEVIKPART